MKRHLHLLFVLLLVVAGVLVARSLPEVPLFPRYARLVISVLVESMPWLLTAAVLAAGVPAAGGFLWRRIGFLEQRRELAESAGRWVSRRGNWLIPVAPLAGLVVPLMPEELLACVARTTGCRENGVPAPLRLALFLAMPVINPAAVIATVVAFPGRGVVVWGRFAGAWGVAVVMALLALAWRVDAVPPPGGDGPRSDGHQGGGGGRSDTPLDGHEGNGGGPGNGLRVSGVAAEVVQRFLALLAPVVVAAALVALLRISDGAAVLAPLQGRLVPAALVLMWGGFLLAVPAAADPFVTRFLLAWIPAPALLAVLITGPAVNLRRLDGVSQRFFLVMPPVVWTLAVLVVLIAARVSL